mgnify:CR=1 FL=1
MTQAKPKDYWISPNALYIERNALNNPDYIQASCTSGAQILVYIKDIIGFDDGHNYRRWSLIAAPTVFNTHTEKYVYAAIPRDLSSTKAALIVFPSESINLYGQNEAKEQIGSADCYYIFLQGILTSSGDNGTIKREWKKGFEIKYGYLSSDEALSAGMIDTVWYEYNSVDSNGLVTFLRDLTMKVGTVFKQLFARTLTIVQGGNLSFDEQKRDIIGVADDVTPVTSNDTIVTPDYLDRNALSRTHRDTAQEEIAFEKGLTAGAYERLTSGAAINDDGAAEVESIVVRRGATFGQSAYIDAAGDASLVNVSVSGVRSQGFTEGDRTLIGGKGFELYKDGSGKSHLYVDNAVIRGKLLAAATEIRKVSYSGGTMIFSNAGSTLIHVVGLDAAGHEVAADASAQAFKCWAAADDGSTRTMNWWKVGDMAMCKTFNIKDSSGGNRYYWRLVIGRGQEVLEDGKLYDYVVLSNLETFAGGDAVVPVNVVSTLTDNEGNIITFGGVVVTMVTDVVMSSLADVVSGQDGSTTDDAGIDIGTRTYYGFDPQGTDIPMAGDVIVQVGSETRFMQRGNAIKLATSADDGDARTAPSLTMYHQIGNTWSTDDGTSSVWQWKTVTAVISPTGVRFNADYFKWFSGSEDNVVDPIVISYTLTPSSTFLVRQVSTGKVEPTDITLSLTKHTGNKVETWNDKGVTLKARYTQRDGLAGEKVIKSVKDIGDLYALLTLRVLAIDAKGQELCYTDIAIISDGEDFDVQVLAEGGNSIFNGEGTKKLTAYVYRNGQDITSTIASTAFSWKRQSSDAADDKIWNSLHVGLGNVCTVTNEDVDRSAMFMCEVEIV